MSTMTPELLDVIVEDYNQRSPNSGTAYRQLLKLSARAEWLLQFGITIPSLERKISELQKAVWGDPADFEKWAGDCSFRNRAIATQLSSKLGLTLTVDENWLHQLTNDAGKIVLETFDSYYLVEFLEDYAA